MPTEQRKNTGLVTIRFDLRTVATIARFYTLKNQTFGSKSDLFKQILCDFEELIIIQGDVERFKETARADLFLSNLVLNFRHRSTDKQYLDQLTIESLSLEKQEDSPDESKIAEIIRENM